MTLQEQIWGMNAEALKRIDASLFDCVNGGQTQDTYKQRAFRFIEAVADIQKGKYNEKNKC